MRYTLRRVAADAGIPYATAYRRLRCQQITPQRVGPLFLLTPAQARQIAAKPRMGRPKAAQGADNG